MIRYYYIDRESKTVQVYRQSLPKTGFSFLGVSDNEDLKMATASFLPNEEGYTIEDTTQGTTT